MVMTMSERFEPYLEHLFIPGFFGTILYITAYSFIGAIWYSFWPLQLLVLISVIGLVISTLVIIIYELFLLVGILKRRSFSVQSEGFYKIVRRLFGSFGAVEMIWVIYTAFDIWSHLPPPITGDVANFVTLDN